MSSMTETLGEVFGTKVAAAHTEEDLTKEANLRFFGDLCVQEGIDVGQLTDEQAVELFKVAMAIKEAKDEGEGEEAGEKEKKAPPFGKKHEEGEGKKEENKEEKEKKAAAFAEWSEKRAASVKVAEAVAQGQIMAHAFVAELQKIASEMGTDPAAPTVTNSSQEKAASVINAFAQLKKAASANTDTPNFDELAAVRAIELLKSASVDPDLAVERVQAVFTLGLGESTKIATIADPDGALTVRALEFCEAAGFEVDWTKA